MATDEPVSPQVHKGMIEDLTKDLREIQSDLRNIARLSPAGPARMRLIQMAEGFEVFVNEAITAARAALPDEME